MSERLRIFRWRAIGPLLVLFVIGGVLWWLFADTIARHESQKVATQMLGARVEIEHLHLDIANGKVLLRGLTIASPHEAFKNLLQADELVADLDVVPLTEKKLIINRVAANGLRFGTPRQTDGRVAATSGDGIAGRVLAETQEWASQFQIPVLQLATGKISIDSLDPRRLSTIPAADALSARADSSRRAWQTAVDTLRLGPTLDSARATLERLRHARATDLAALNEARQAIDRLKRARDRVTALDRGVKTGVADLQAGLAGLDSARRRAVCAGRHQAVRAGPVLRAAGAPLHAAGALAPRHDRTAPRAARRRRCALSQRARLARLPAAQRRAVVPAAALRRAAHGADQRSGAVWTAHGLRGNRTAARGRRHAQSRARDSGRHRRRNTRGNHASSLRGAGRAAQARPGRGHDAARLRPERRHDPRALRDPLDERALDARLRFREQHDRQADLAGRVRHLESRRRVASVGRTASSGSRRAVESRSGDRVAPARGPR